MLSIMFCSSKNYLYWTKVFIQHCFRIHRGRTDRPAGNGPSCVYDRIKIRMMTNSLFLMLMRMKLLCEQGGIESRNEYMMEKYGDKGDSSYLV